MTNQVEMSLESTIKKLALITGKPHGGQALREALQTLETKTRNEPGCQAFTFFQALSNPDAFALVETFSNQAALDLHMREPHTQTFFALQLVADVQVVGIV